MACRLDGAKPLSEPMLAFCQSHPKEHISMKFHLTFKYFHSRKWVWTCRLRNDGHFVQGEMSKHRRDGNTVRRSHRFSQKWQLRVCKWNFRVCKMPLLAKIPMRIKEFGWFYGAKLAQLPLQNTGWGWGWGHGWLAKTMHGVITGPIYHYHILCTVLQWQQQNIKSWTHKRQLMSYVISGFERKLMAS